MGMCRIQRRKDAQPESWGDETNDESFHVFPFFLEGAKKIDVQRGNANKTHEKNTEKLRPKNTWSKREQKSVTKQALHLTLRLHNALEPLPTSFLNQH